MKVDLQPTLAGQLITLRPLEESDFTALCGVAADPLIWQQHPASDRYQENVFRDFFEDAMNSGGALIAIDMANDEIVGSSRYHAYSEEQRNIEIGWSFLARRCWGGVYNGEMKQLMLRHAFTFVESVLFIIGTENIRSQKAVEKIGANRIGSRSDATGTNYVYELNPAAYTSTPHPAH